MNGTILTTLQKDTIMRQRNAEEILAAQGIDPKATGPYVTEWRDRVQKMIDGGMVNMGGGSWAPDAPVDSEIRAKAMLARGWASENASHQVRLLDAAPIEKKYNLDKERGELNSN